MARTGFPSRFLVGGQALSPRGRVLVTLLLVVVGTVLCAGGIFMGIDALARSVDPQSELHRLARPVTPRERRRGVVRGAARVAPETPRMGLCRVEHQHFVSGKNGGWRTDGTFVLLERATLLLDGEPYRIETHVGSGPFDPLRMSVVSGDDIATHLPDIDARFVRGRYVQQCAAPGTTVFVEGCRVAPGLLSDCQPGALESEPTPLRVTTGAEGSPQPRIDDVAAGITAQFAGAALSILALLGWVWFLLRARPVVDPLLGRAGLLLPSAPRRELAWVVVPIGMAAVQGIVASYAPAQSPAAVFQGGYTFAVAVACGAFYLAAVVRRRRISLENATRPVLAAPTVSLREARGEMVELCVRTTDDAPIVGPVSGKRRAWVRVAVYETLMVQRHSITRQVATSARPRRIAVHDSSGDGEVDAEGVEPDLRALRRQFRADQSPAVLQRLQADFGIALTPQAGHVHWTVEESFLDPGEAVYLLGDAQRVDDPKAAASYRADATRPIISGGHHGLILHAGDERSLLALLHRERRWLDLLGATSVGLALSVVGLAAVLATR